MPLAIPLSKNHGPLFRQVYLGLREAILTGAFDSGQKLPSTRDLAEQLGISRTVALLAYDQLLAEGFVIGRSGSGTYVHSGVSMRSTASAESAAFRLSRFGSLASAASVRVSFPERHKRSLPYDFAYGRSDSETFPFEMWRRILLRCARKATVSEFDYGPAMGNPALRDAISTHLRRSRAVVSDPSQVIIVNGSQQALDLIAKLHRAFDGRRRELLARRAKVQAELDQGWLPDFLPETGKVRQEDWTVAPLPRDLLDRL